MALGLNMTIALLAMIWLATVYLAFLIAKTNKAPDGKPWIYMAMMLVLLILAVILASDRWYFDIF